MTTFAIAPAALHVDVPDEAGARAILTAFAAAAGMDFRRALWKPYPKLGPHSRLTFFAAIGATDEAAAVAEVDGICAALCGADARAGDSIDFRNEDGSRWYERILSKGLHGDIFFPGTHWFDIELNLYGEAQEDLRRLLAPDG